MRRLQFLAGLFGFTAAAKAQVKYACKTPTECNLVYEPNTCPVCGEVADKYVRLTEAEAYGSDACLTESDGRTALAICRAPDTKKLVGLMERIVRCKNCNNAFFQDAEK